MLRHEFTLVDGFTNGSLVALSKTSTAILAALAYGLAVYFIVQDSMDEHEVRPVGNLETVAASELAVRVDRARQIGFPGVGTRVEA
jgi:hypothetical protein